MVLSISQLAEIAVIASSRAQVVIQSQSSLSKAHLQNYLNCYRKLSVTWYQRLNELTNASQLSTDSQPSFTVDTVSALFQEIFVAEILTRVWATVLMGHGRVQFHTSAEQLARHAISTHTQISQRALLLLSENDSLPLLDVAEIHRARRKTERWTDVLIGHCGNFANTFDFAHDRSEASDLATLPIRRLARAVDEPVSALLRASIRTAFEKCSEGVSSPTISLAQLILQELPESDGAELRSLNRAFGQVASSGTTSKLKFSKNSGKSLRDL